MEVLVVEDNEVVADSLAFLLDCHGHRTAVAYDGETALSLLRSRAFELVFIDENLPGIHGSTVALSILSSTAAARPFLVSMTGDRDNDEPRQLFDACLLKPFPAESLLRVISAARRGADTDARLAA